MAVLRRYVHGLKQETPNPCHSVHTYLSYSIYQYCHSSADFCRDSLGVLPIAAKAAGR
jgi:hypothetical protein